jgi:hypothetical protein
MIMNGWGDDSNIEEEEIGVKETVMKTVMETKKQNYKKRYNILLMMKGMGKYWV